MNEHDVLKKNHNFYIGVGGTVLEGLLSGSLFMLLYSVMQFLWSGQFDMNRVLALTGIIAVVFLLRILIYSYGYTKAQIGGSDRSGFGVKFCDPVSIFSGKKAGGDTGNEDLWNETETCRGDVSGGMCLPDTAGLCAVGISV